jgi:hypothetical protein
MPDNCRGAGLALWRGLRGAAANRMTPHRAPAPTHQGKARSGRPSSAEQSHLVLESIVGDAVYQKKILAAK